MNTAEITIAVPCLNQGRYLEQALASIFQQMLSIEVFVMDGGSTDNTLDVIRRWETRLVGWRSHQDAGQAAAINEGIAMGTAPYVCWLNSDDMLLPGGLDKLLKVIELKPEVPAVYGRVLNLEEVSGKSTSVWVEPFNVDRLALRCIVSQPATLIRREVWESLGGLRQNLHMAMDYDLWWRIYRNFGPLLLVDEDVAINREHAETKTKKYRRQHYQEAIAVVREHYGKVPVKWWLAQPYAVWYKSIFG